MRSISVSHNHRAIDRARQELQAIELPDLYLQIRRGCELLAVIISLPLLLPICLALAVIVRLDSPGPIFFWQERPGKDGEIFRMVKFRSMFVHAEDARRLTVEGDERVTRTGRWMRHSHLDELPQFWNVLRGEMSLIGPRPEPVIFSELFEKNIPLYSFRRLVRPGITGWSQVHQGYTADVESTWRKLEYDLYYIKHLSPWLDLQIFMRTVIVMVTGENAR